MTDAVFNATLHNIVFIKTRGVVQIQLETPIEHASRVLEVLGTPNPAEEHWVAVARLVGFDGKKTPKVKTEGETDKGFFEANCQDPAFQAWCWKHVRLDDKGDGFREAMKRFLGIESANEFLTNPEAGKDFRALWESFKYKDALR